MPELNIFSTSAADTAGASGQVLQPVYTTSETGYNYGGANNPNGDGFLEFGSGTPGSLPFHVDQNGNVTAASTTAPQASTYAEVSASYRPVFTVTPTGGADSGLPFQIAAGALTVDAVLGPVVAFGYNAVNGMQNTPSASGSACINFWGHAGDTNVGGARGIECNLSFFTADASKATAAFQLVAVDDNTNTVTTSIRCGSSATSAVQITNGTGTQFMAFANTATPTVSVYAPFYLSQQLASTALLFTMTGNNSATSPVTALLNSTGPSASPALMTIQSAGTSSTAALTLSATGTTSAAVITLNGTPNAELLFANSSTGTQWNINSSPPYLVFTDSVNSRTAVTFYPGTTLTGKVQVNSHLVVQTGSMIVGIAALTTTATDGFLYLPSCPGAPTGVPSAKTGTNAAVYDTTNNKIWVYNGSWRGIVVV